jgi:hypothetical protein
MTKTIERKYQMIRVSAGDYLLPSNGGKTLWRIRRYYEDGSAVSGRWPNEKPIIGYFWSCARYKTPLQEIPPHVLGEHAEDFLNDWCSWVECASLMKTRSEAVNEALEISERRGT